MKIGQILQEQQPEEFKKLNIECNGKRGSKNLSFSDYKKIMSHSCYKRSKGGAIRQVK